MSTAIHVSPEEARTLAKQAGRPELVEPEPPETEAPAAEPPRERSHWDTIDDFLKGPKPKADEPPPERGPEAPASPFGKSRENRHETEPVRSGMGGILTRYFTPEKPVGRLAGRIASLPTPGGLFPWLAILFVLLFALVPVNGTETRLSLIWRSMTGGVTLPKDHVGQQIDQEWAKAAADAAEHNQIVSDLQGAVEGAWAGFWSVEQSVFGGTGSSGADADVPYDGMLPMSAGGWSPDLLN